MSISAAIVVLAGAFAMAPGVIRAEAGAGEKAPKPEKPAGPAKKMKVVDFVTLETAGILKIKFLDAKGKATKAPDSGTLSYRTSITKPRKGSMPLSKGKWKPGEKVYVFTGIAPRQRYVCPPRSYFIRVRVQAGKKRFTGFLRKKFKCI